MSVPVRRALRALVGAPRVERARRLESALRRRIPAAWGGALDAEPVELRVLRRSEAPPVVDLALWWRGGCVGQAVITDGFLGQPGTWIAGLFVAPALRGRGLGRRLLRRARGEAAHVGASPLLAAIAEPNRRSRRACLAAGFRRIEDRALEEAITAVYAARGDRRRYVVVGAPTDRRRGPPASA